MFPYYTSKRLTKEGNEKILYEFTQYKITKEQISEQSNQIVMFVRPSMKKDLEHISGIDGGNLIYSMREEILSGSIMFFASYGNYAVLFELEISGWNIAAAIYQLNLVLSLKNNGRH